MPRFQAARAPRCATRTGIREPGTAAEPHGRFRWYSLLQGSRPWNSPIEHWRALTAAPSSFLLRASRSSSTINNSKTTPSAASSARRSGFAEARRCVLKHALPAPSVEPKLRFHSSPPRADQYFAAAVSKNRGKWSLQRRSRPANARPVLASSDCPRRIPMRPAE